MTTGIKIDMESDIADFINRLEKFDKDTSKGLKAAMKHGTTYVVKAAKARIDRIPNPPMSNWAYSWVEQDRSTSVRNLVWNSARAKSQVKPAAFRARRRGKTIAYGYQAVQKNPAASIYELAGSQNPGGGPQAFKASARPGSYTFNRNLMGRVGAGPYPRILYPSYYDGIEEAREYIEDELQRARKRVGL